MNATKRNALGRGLGALLSADEAAAVVTQATTNWMIPVTQIEANPFQPRTDFEEVALKELADSIRIHGVIQPLTVRKLTAGQYQLVSGERRLRASKLVGLEEVPAYVLEANQQGMLEMALIENIQRQDLNAIEVAISFKRLQEECQIKQEELGERVGKDRATVANYLRLLKLPPEIQLGLRNAAIGMGHARALLGLTKTEQQLFVYRKTVAEGLSVRKVEALVREMNSDDAPAKGGSKKKEEGTPSAYKAVQDSLQQKFEARIQIKANDKGKGEILIPFASTDDLNRILDLLES
ncbi:MAG: ParB/RepB/Spo0J family partition protein [Sphingobacteriaceae bacterium]|nr:ParB/RepB/Spo0J family partition protein [Sphingobacteriaceae bacterium]